LEERRSSLEAECRAAQRQVSDAGVQPDAAASEDIADLLQFHQLELQLVESDLLRTYEQLRTSVEPSVVESADPVSALREARITAELTQGDLASRIGGRQSGVARDERTDRARLGWERIVAWANACGYAPTLRLTPDRARRSRSLSLDLAGQLLEAVGRFGATPDAARLAIAVLVRRFLDADAAMWIDLRSPRLGEPIRAYSLLRNPDRWREPQARVALVGLLRESRNGLWLRRERASSSCLLLEDALAAGAVAIEDGSLFLVFFRSEPRLSETHAIRCLQVLPDVAAIMGRWCEERTTGGTEPASSRWTPAIVHDERATAVQDRRERMLRSVLVGSLPERYAARCDVHVFRRTDAGFEWVPSTKRPGRTSDSVRRAMDDVREGAGSLLAEPNVPIELPESGDSPRTRSIAMRWLKMGAAACVVAPKELAPELRRWVSGRLLLIEASAMLMDRLCPPDADARSVDSIFGAVTSLVGPDAGRPLEDAARPGRPSAPESSAPVARDASLRLAQCIAERFEYPLVGFCVWNHAIDSWSEARSVTYLDAKVRRHHDPTGIEPEPSGRSYSVLRGDPPFDICTDIREAPSHFNCYLGPGADSEQSKQVRGLGAFRCMAPGVADASGVLWLGTWGPLTERTRSALYETGHFLAGGLGAIWALGAEVEEPEVAGAALPTRA
jgi:transcriptional regulator with XRE-family HTH domain